MLAGVSCRREKRKPLRQWGRRERLLIRPRQAGMGEGDGAVGRWTMDGWTTEKEGVEMQQYAVGLTLCYE